ncbi:MAG: hypothetical protein ACON38_08275 [Akkermansiaceae bacterium]
MRWLLPFLALLGPVDARLWMSKEGVEVEAKLVEVWGDQVTLEIRATRKLLTAPIAGFSQKDQDYLVSVRDARQAELRKPNWDDPWPGNITPDGDVEIIEEERNEETGEYVYLSPHYKFICDARLGKSVVRSFARLFEATHASMEALPFTFLRARASNPNHRHPILLFETRAGYQAKGGPPGSSGVYIGGRNGGVVMVPLTSLGVRPIGSGYMRDRKKSNKTLPHELVHQLTDYEYYAHGSRGWFTEGLAEYVALSQMSDARFNFQTNLDEIRAYAAGFGKDGRGGRALGEEIRLPSLRAFMLQPYSRFTTNANFNYGMGLLVTTYFIHLEDGGSRKNLTNFLKAMREGKSGDELLAVLRAGRTWEGLAQDISRTWRSKGVKIEIGP